MSELSSLLASCKVVPEVEVDALVGRLLSWWWNRFRRTLPELLAAERDAAGGGLEAMVRWCLVDESCSSVVAE